MAISCEADIGLAIPTCITAHAWLTCRECMPGSLISDFLWSRWRGKRSRYSRRMCNTIFYVSGKRPMAYPFSRNINLPPTSNIWRSLIPLPVTVVLNILLGGWVGGGGGRGCVNGNFLRGWYRASDPDMHHGTCMTHVPWMHAGIAN